MCSPVYSRTAACASCGSDGELKFEEANAVVACLKSYCDSEVLWRIAFVDLITMFPSARLSEVLSDDVFIGRYKKEVRFSLLETTSTYSESFSREQICFTKLYR